MAAYICELQYLLLLMLLGSRLSWSLMPLFLLNFGLRGVGRAV